MDIFFSQYRLLFSKSRKCHLFEASRVQAPSSSLHLHVFKLHDFSLFLCQRYQSYQHARQNLISLGNIVLEQTQQTEVEDYHEGDEVGLHDIPINVEEDEVGPL
ncbi:hypothetical protein L1887_19113 [Cichorium endivia]|nr:hypothetical protein L1887_19113 [Cichorium endivia]